MPCTTGEVAPLADNVLMKFPVTAVEVPETTDIPVTTAEAPAVDKLLMVLVAAVTTLLPEPLPIAIPVTFPPPLILVMVLVEILSAVLPPKLNCAIEIEPVPAGKFVILLNILPVNVLVGPLEALRPS